MRMITNHLDSDFLRYLLTVGCQPGERLPSLEEIGAEIGISVGKLREQFEVARVLGLVEASPRRGIRCLKYEFLPVVRLGLIIALALDPSAFRAFSALRIHLETAFWDEAVALLTDEDKLHLRELVIQAKSKLTGERIRFPTPNTVLFISASSASSKTPLRSASWRRIGMLTKPSSSTPTPITAISPTFGITTSGSPRPWPRAMQPPARSC